jgi:hypothetical protein
MKNVRKYLVSSNSAVSRTLSDDPKIKGLNQPSAGCGRKLQRGLKECKYTADCSSAVGRTIN